MYSIDISNDFQEYLKNYPASFVILDDNGSIIDVNEHFIELIGFTRNELSVLHLSDLMSEVEHSKLANSLTKAYKLKRFYDELSFSGKSGLQIRCNIEFLKLKSDGILLFVTPNTAQQNFESKSHRLNRILDAYRTVVRHIVRTKDERILIEKVCQILTDYQGYYNAWIALYNMNKEFSFFAESGVGDDFIHIKQALMDNDVPDCAFKALNCDDVILIHNPPTECKQCPLSYIYPEKGAASIKLHYNEQIFGTMTVSLPLEYLKDIDEINLFIELTEDLSYALHQIQKDKEIRRLENIIRTVQQPMSLVSPDYKFIAVNDFYGKLFNLELSNIVNRPIAELFDKDYFLTVIKPNLDRALTGDHVTFNTIYQFTGLGKRDMEINYYPYYDLHGDVTGVVVNCTDITKQKASEKRIQTLLREKELLLREVHHRIKNNMNTVKNLLYLQAMKNSDTVVRNILESAERRITSMMILYDKLYKGNHNTEIFLNDYLTSLVQEALKTHNQKVVVLFNIVSVKVSVSIASALGIIVNELITNSMKYAFSNDTQNKLTISAQIVNENVVLKISDNGPGFKFDKKDGFGLELVTALTEQIRGDFLIESNNGTLCTLTFPNE
jgi:PAS domain S-box-containing protein